MKKLLLLVFVLVSVYSAALAKSGDKLVEKKGYLVKDNSLVELKRGKLFPVKALVKLDNGYTLHPNGAITSPEGIRRTLREGEGIAKNGHIMFAGKKNGKIVLLDTPENFFTYDNIYGNKKVRTVTGISVEDVHMPTTPNTTYGSKLR